MQLTKDNVTLQYTARECSLSLFLPTLNSLVTALTSVVDSLHKQIVITVTGDYRPMQGVGVVVASSPECWVANLIIAIHAL